MQDFRRLLVWQRAHAFSIEVRRATRAFPRGGQASLTLQLTRAAESIALNIVEGSAARSRREFARFVDIGVRSSREVEAQLLLARDYSMLSDHAWRTLAGEVVQIRRMLCGLRAALLRAEAETPKGPGGDPIPE